MQNFNLQDRHLAMTAIGTLHRLSLLDELWTGYLAEATQIPERDVATLGELSNEMRSLLDDARHQLQLLRAPFGKLEIDLDERFAALFASGSLPRDMKDKALARVRRDGGMKPRTLAAMDEVIRKAPGEQAELERKMATIRGGRHVPGDLTVACAIDAIGIGVGLGFGGLGGAALAVYAFGRSVQNHCWG
jgi:hypothetical protein